MMVETLLCCLGSDVRTLSSTVSYHDLDLSTRTGRDVLSQRVRAAARDLCRRLGEPGNMGTAAAPSCERDAINGTRNQQRPAANAKPNAYTVNPPAPAHVAPAAGSCGQGASSVTTETVTNPPVRDTPENRATYGGPMSSGGQRTAPNGN